MGNRQGKNGESNVVRRLCVVSRESSSVEYAGTTNENERQRDGEGDQKGVGEGCTE